MPESKFGVGAVYLSRSTSASLITQAADRESGERLIVGGSVRAIVAAVMASHHKAEGLPKTEAAINRPATRSPIRHKRIAYRSESGNVLVVTIESP